MINPTVHELYDIIYNERDKNVAYMNYHFQHKTIPLLDQQFLQYHPFTKKLIFNRDFTEHAINTLFPALIANRDLDFWIDWRVNKYNKDFIELMRTFKYQKRHHMILGNKNLKFFILNYLLCLIIKLFIP